MLTKVAPQAVTVGKGGDVLFCRRREYDNFDGTSNIKQSLKPRRRKWARKEPHGKCGKDLYIKVPVGTIVKDISTIRL